MLYLGLVLLALVSCGVSFSLEIVIGNIGHIKNGRKPNAGAAVLPTIPLVPAMYVLAAWGLNHLYPNAGYVVVAAYGGISISIGVIQYRRARAQLQALQPGA